MNNPSDVNSASVDVEPFEEKDSLCFRAPGGQMGLPRLKGLTELLDVSDKPSVTVTRRQAIVVRASFEPIPDYVHEELDSTKISVPNVKSYPLPANPGGAIVRKLSNAIDSLPDIPTLSYSPLSRYRSELKQDDFCINRSNDRSLSVTSTISSDSPVTLVENVPIKYWQGLTEGLIQITSNNMDDKTTRSIKRTLTRAINQAEPTPTPSKSGPLIDEGVLLEHAGESPARFPTADLGEGDRSWILVTIPGGHIAPEDLETIIEITRSMSLNQLYLSPEQNVLLQVPTQQVNEARSTLADKIEDPLVGIPYRISTCPGSRFCVNAEYDSIQLARRISTFLNDHPNLATFNHTHPIAVASCGNTLKRERLHPVAIVPSRNDSTLEVHMGGTPHEPSRPGVPVDDQLTYDEITGAIKQLIEEFMASENDSLHDWATARRID